MDFFIQQLVTGLAVGGTYALVALGFVLIFGVANVLNIAHAVSIMSAPMALALLVEFGGLSPALAFPLAMGLTIALGIAVYGAAVRPFLAQGKEQEFLAPFIASFGVSLLIEHLTGVFFGSEPRPFPLAIPMDVVRLGGIALVPMQMVSLGTVTVLALGLAWLVGRTGFGRAMRAVAENRVVAESQGVSARGTIVITVTVASVLGAIAGLLFAAGTNNVSPFMGMEYGLKGLVVMIVGGVTSLWGAVIAGLLLGVLEALSIGYVSSTFSTAISFGLLTVVLLLRPQGLFVGASRESRP